MRILSLPREGGASRAIYESLPHIHILPGVQTIKNSPLRPRASVLLLSSKGPADQHFLTRVYPTLNPSGKESDVDPRITQECKSFRQKFSDSFFTFQNTWFEEIVVSIQFCTFSIFHAFFQSFERPARVFPRGNRYFDEI